MTTIFKTASIALATLLGAPALGARSQNVLIVIHAKDSASKRAAQYISYGFREALRKTGDRFQTAPLGPLYGDRDVDVERLQKEADALAAEGMLAYDNLEIETAKKKFDEGLALFEQNLGEFDSLKPAARLALLSAGAALVASNERLGRTLMGRALLYDSNAQPDPRVYNSAMLSVFKDVRQKAGKVQQGSLAVSTNPAYAELYVDGDFIGMTPEKIDRIDSGPHLVRVVRDGFRAAAEVVDVKGGRNETTITENLVAMPQQMQVQSMIEKAIGDLQNPSSSSASALAAKGRALYVLVCEVAVNGDQVKVQAGVFHADNRRLGAHDKSFSAQADTYLEESAGLWDKLQDNIANAAAGLDTQRAITRARPIVTGLLVVGGAAILAGSGFGVLALLAQNPYRQMQQIAQTVPAARADLRSKALMADVLIFSGAAIATAGILCLVLLDDRLVNKQKLGMQFDLSVSPSGAFVGAHGTF